MAQTVSIIIASEDRARLAAVIASQDAEQVLVANLWLRQHIIPPAFGGRVR
jgi:hypothetical protein